MSLVEVLVGLVATCVVLAFAARYARVPPAVALVLGGMALAFIPAMPRVELDPHIALHVGHDVLTLHQSELGLLVKVLLKRVNAGKHLRAHGAWFMVDDS